MSIGGSGQSGRRPKYNRAREKKPSPAGRAGEGSSALSPARYISAGPSPTAAPSSASASARPVIQRSTSWAG